MARGERRLIPVGRSVVAAAGGVTVIAHPWGRSGRERPDERDLGPLIEAGLSGLEVDHQDHSPQVRERLRALARSLDVSAGEPSHFHAGPRGPYACHDPRCRD